MWASNVAVETAAMIVTAPSTLGTQPGLKETRNASSLSAAPITMAKKGRFSSSADLDVRSLSVSSGPDALSARPMPFLRISDMLFSVLGIATPSSSPVW